MPKKKLYRRFALQLEISSFCENLRHSILYLDHQKEVFQVWISIRSVHYSLMLCVMQSIAPIRYFYIKEKSEDSKCFVADRVSRIILLQLVRFMLMMLSVRKQGNIVQKDIFYMVALPAFLIHMSIQDYLIYLPHPEADASL